MLVVYGTLLFLLGAAFFTVVPFVWVRARSIQLADPRTIICPETHRWATVTADGVRAARAELASRTDIRFVACSRWPERKDCDQACVPQFVFVGDDRRVTRYAPFALHPRFLRINNPVRMSPAVYDRFFGGAAH